MVGVNLFTGYNLQPVLRINFEFNTGEKNKNGKQVSSSLETQILCLWSASFYSHRSRMGFARVVGGISARVASSYLMDDFGHVCGWF
jgi:hypothetical protein